MGSEPASDRGKTEAFASRVMNDTSGLLVTVMAAIGDRLGLFKSLSDQGPATSAELAARAGINERYAREWLGGMASAGYVEYDPGSGRFRVPAEHAAVLAQEAGPFFIGGVYQRLIGMLKPLDLLLRAFREGGGVPVSVFNDDVWEGMERGSVCWVENLLVQQWMPAVSDVQARLEQGAAVADVGCGHGRALIKLAQAFPKSRYVGYDVFEPTIRRAAVYAEAAGVADRVSFRCLDAARGLPEQYDVITSFDVLHDAVDPSALLRAIRRALRPDGTYLLLEINCSDRLEENSGPIASTRYGNSILYCMTTSLAEGGAGLGTLGLPEPRLRELCGEAGFHRFRRVLANPFSILYEIRL